MDEKTAVSALFEHQIIIWFGEKPRQFHFSIFHCIVVHLGFQGEANCDNFWYSMNTAYSLYSPNSPGNLFWILKGSFELEILHCSPRMHGSCVLVRWFFPLSKFRVMINECSFGFLIEWAICCCLAHRHITCVWHEQCVQCSIYKSPLFHPRHRHRPREKATQKKNASVFNLTEKGCSAIH